jgi:hypothetical protein
MTKPDFFVTNRSIFSHWTYLDAAHWVFKLWVTVIGRAAWEDRPYSHWRMSIPLKRGQLICTETELGKMLKQDKRRISDWLDKFCNQGMILIEYVIKDGGSKSLNNRTSTVTEGETGHRTAQKTGYRIVSRTEKPKYRSILGLRITICNYDKYQLEPVFQSIDENSAKRTEARTGSGTKARTGNRTTDGTRTRTINNKEDKEQREKDNISAERARNPTKENSLTPENAIVIWNELRGPLPAITTGYSQETQKELIKLVNHFNHIARDYDSPVELYRVFVAKTAKTTLPEHYQTIRLPWLSQKLSRIDQVEAGVFAKSYNKSGDEHGGTKRGGGSSKGSLEEYRRKDEESRGGGFHIVPPTKV